MAPQVNVPASIKRCRSGTVAGQLPLARNLLAREDLSRCKLHKAGIGITKTMTSAAMLKAVFENRKPALSTHVPGTDLSQPLSIGVHINMERSVKVMPTATTKPIPA